MASPNFDALHVKLSRKIFDPIASGSEDTDGAEVSSALRTDYLNRANKFIQFFVYGYDKDLDKKLTQKFLSGLSTSQSITFSGSGTAVNSDYSFPLSCVYLAGAGAANIHPLPIVPPDLIITRIRNPFLKDSFTVFGGKVYGVYNDAALGSGIGALYYIKNDQRTSAKDTNDIAIDSIWYDTLVELAATYHFEDKGKLDFAAAQERRSQLVLSVINAATV